LAEKGAFGISGAEGIRLHALAWECFVRFALGEWNEVIDEVFPLTESLLGDRAKEPPYFVANAFGANAFILDARDAAGAGGAVDQLQRLAALDRRRPTLVIASWTGWIHSRNGRYREAQECLDVLDRAPSQAPRPFLEQVRATMLAEAERWDEAAAFVTSARAYARDAGLRALPAHLDRLEGRVACAEGRFDDAIRLLRAASASFGELRARWERACTDLSLAEALLATDRREDARAALDGASRIVEELGSSNEIARGRELLERS
jgi:tetratricopeptide (TPR) repeat protein